MGVYVDDMEAPYGRMIMCHCWADSRQELFDMMNKIGVNTKWFQQPPDASWEHFDISKAKRKLAVANGAIEIDRYGPLEHEAWNGIRSGEHNRIVRGVKKLEMVHNVRQG